jgi:hypothetical protein
MATSNTSVILAALNHREFFLTQRFECCPVIERTWAETFHVLHFWGETDQYSETLCSEKRWTVSKLLNVIFKLQTESL